jgi:hypothetical protein
MVVITAAPCRRRAPGRAAGRQQPLSQAQQRPVFRGGHPFRARRRLSGRGRQESSKGSQPADFEVLEDGKPQTIESFRLRQVRHLHARGVAPRSPTQREGFRPGRPIRATAVFVIFVDMAYSKETGAVSTINDQDRIQSPLIGFLDRVLGPQDLFGFLTSAQLGQGSRPRQEDGRHGVRRSWISGARRCRTSRRRRRARRLQLRQREPLRSTSAGTDRHAQARIAPTPPTRH